MKTGWSQSGDLITGNSSIVSLQAKLETAATFTVQFGVTGADSLGGEVVTEAEISWSIDGNTVRRIISVFNGASISGLGHNVRVAVSDKSVIGAGRKYTVIILVTMGTRGISKQPVVYSPDKGQITVNPAAFTEINVPQNAGITSVFITATTVNATGVPPSGDILNNSNVCVLHRNLSNFGKMYSPLDYDWVPVMAGISIIRLINGLTTGHSQIIFTVTYGIDG